MSDAAPDRRREAAPIGPDRLARLRFEVREIYEPCDHLATRACLSCRQNRAEDVADDVPDVLALLDATARENRELRAIIAAIRAVDAVRVTGDGVGRLWIPLLHIATIFATMPVPPPAIAEKGKP